MSRIRTLAVVITTIAFTSAVHHLVMSQPVQAQEAATALQQDTPSRTAVCQRRFEARAWMATIRAWRTE